jgi:hypothetical protein
MIGNVSMTSPFRKTSKLASRNMEEIIMYLIFTFAAAVGARFLSDVVFSALMTLSAAFQCLGFGILLRQVTKGKAVGDVSSKSLQLYAVAITARLYSTLQYNGYLPLDRTGDWVYQLIEFLEVVIVVLTIVKVARYQCYLGDANDTCQVWPMLLLCGVMALTMHPGLNYNATADIAWTFGLYLESVAMVPQLFMLGRRGGEVESMQGHYIACVFMSRVLMMWFWLTCYEELQPRDSAFNLPGLGVMGMQLLQVVLFADFMYLYGKSVRDNVKLVLPYAGSTI